MPTPADEARWEEVRKDRLQRHQIDEAKRGIAAGRFERYAKPGKWRVFKQDDRIVVEIF